MTTSLLLRAGARTLPSSNRAAIPTEARANAPLNHTQDGDDDNQWQDLNDAKRQHTIQIAEIQANQVALVIFKSKQETLDLFVAVPAKVFQDKFENIMSARESIVNSMWPILLVYILCCTWFLTYWVMRSLQNLKNSFKDIELKGQGIALSDKKFDVEFASFVAYFNSLIQRLQMNYAQASRFSSDAAHELRTPLTVIKGYVEMLSKDQLTAPADKSRAFNRVGSEITRMETLIQDLLLLAELGESGARDIEVIDLSEIVSAHGTDFTTLNPDRVVGLQVTPGLSIVGSRDYISRIHSKCPQ